MRIGIQVPDEWGVALEAAAKKDGHSNLSAVIRKAVQLFLFADNENSDTKKEHKSVTTQQK